MLLRYVGLGAFLLCTPALVAPLDIPPLTWEERSDWINVKTGVEPGAVGDGQADDTAAIQAALDQAVASRTVYLPPGTYRITRTLVFNGPGVGSLVVGHGRDTRIVWDGPEGGRMFHSNGMAYTRYVGLSWDGRGKAAVGFDHAAAERFETEVRHEYEAYRNFSGYGIRVGNEQKVASAEILYRNCLFENCGTALAFLTFNDYDNTVDRCEFLNCGTGIFDNKGNFYARNCHFEGTREVDFSIGSEHGSSIRRCTSVGSRRFIEERGTIAPLTVQDCHVVGWTDPEGAVFLNGSPALIFDCSFERGPSDNPPVVAPGGQKLFVSNNRPDTIEGLVRLAPGATLYEIPPGRRGGVVTSAEQRFLMEEVGSPGRVFDAGRDFGAKGDGQTDNTAAIQATIDAARAAGDRAVAYLPTGTYIVTQPLRVTGSGYSLCGSGFRCMLVWRGEAGLPMVDVADAHGVTLASFAVGHPDSGPMTHGADIQVTAPSGQACRVQFDEVSAYGMYQKAPDAHGIRFVSLPKGSVIDALHVQGNLWIADSARATFLFRTSYEGTVTIEGASTERDGFIGFQTRLATIAKPTLRVRDNQSVVASDFYAEQSDQHIVLEGKPGQPEGAVTIQGPKMHMFSQEPVFDIHDYAGRVYYGQSQFYIEPKEPRFVSSGTQPARLILAGHFWYDTTPKLELGPEVKLTLIGNRDVPDTGVDPQALSDIAAALDDLRHLGEVDLGLD